MSKVIHTLNLYIMIINIFLYIASIVLFSIIIKDYLNDPYYQTNITMIADFIFLISYLLLLFNTLIFGLHGLNFAIPYKLLIYSISSLFLFTVISVMLVVGFLHNAISISNLGKLGWSCASCGGFSLFLLLISVVISFIERKEIIKEYTNTPLSQINENISEELYKNILSQSVNPNDKHLEEEYKRIINKNRSNSNNS